MIEASYAQKRKHLTTIAEDYILGSDSDTRVVVGLDVEYRAGRKATISIWRLEVIHDPNSEGVLVATEVIKEQVGSANGE